MKLATDRWDDKVVVEVKRGGYGDLWGVLDGVSDRALDLTYILVFRVAQEAAKKAACRNGSTSRTPDQEHYADAARVLRAMVRVVLDEIEARKEMSNAPGD